MFLRPVRPYDDHPHLDDLARHRWGPTGFRCPHCDHPHACRIRTRPRVRQCRRCRRQTSVTAGTLLHGSRLPLAAWVERCLGYERHPAQVPSTSDLAYRLGVARSTAWHLNQRMFLCAEEGAREVLAQRAGTGSLVLHVRVRRPRPTPPLPDAAPAHVRTLHIRHRENLVRPVVVAIGLRTGDRALSLGRVALTPEEVRAWDADLPSRVQLLDHRGFQRYFRWGLVLLPRTVSLRWLPRWTHAVLAGWNLQGDVRPPPWQEVVVACGRRPLRTLDPWRAAMH